MNFYTKRTGNLAGGLYKFLLVMRIMFLLLVVGIMQVSAKTYGQRFTMNQKNVTIKEIFKNIKSQTGYDVLWPSKELNTNKVIDANFNQAALKDVVQKCIENQNVTFEVEDKSIVIKLKAASSILNTQSLLKDSVTYKGIVYDENAKPLAGATVRLRGSTRGFLTTNAGSFVIYGPEKTFIVISYIGYVTKELEVSAKDVNKIFKVTMTTSATGLGEVKIASNGYQDIPAERSTGSFEVISKEQLQHSSDPNLVRRLEGITTSMDFRNDLTPINSAKGTGLIPAPLDNLTIRGRNTLNIGSSPDNTSGQVLVVIDGIASAYSIDQINPNDVESITILKDAAAASIWGSRAANGVIVVKTKRGSYQSPLQISFNSNFNTSDKFNLFYKKYMSVSDYVDAQIFQYNKQFNPSDPTAFIGDPQLNVGQPAISPVADIMNQEKRGLITSDEAHSQLNVLRNSDIRNDYTKYILRNPFTQSYSLALSGGNKGMAQRLSINYDNTKNNTVNSGSNRAIVTYGISAKPLPKLEFQANIVYSQTNNTDQASQTGIQASVGGSFYPYTKLADNMGNPLIVPRVYSPQFEDLLSKTYGNKILNYDYIPLDDINQGYNKIKAQNINVNLGVNYQIASFISASLGYNYNILYSDNTDLESADSWYMRNLINVNTSASTLIQNIPLGDSYSDRLTKSHNQTLRGQLNLNKNWNDKHNISAIAGVDVSDSYSLLTSSGFYGYNPTTLTTIPNLDFKNIHELLFADPSSGLGYNFIPGIGGILTRYDARTISYFTNLAYTYDKKYTLTASFRRDLSSLYYTLGGDKGGTPFYSLGGGWDISSEKFYNFSLLPALKFRATFGYNGNVNPAASPVPIITYTPASQVYTGNLLGYANAGNPTNSELRPEKTAVLNMGLDFGVKGGRLSGSFEYYQKITTDLLTNNKVDPTSGFDYLVTNTGNLRGWGTDFTLNSLNIKTGLFRWNSTFLFSYNKVKVTKLFSPITYNSGSLISNPFAYTQGYDLSRAFAFKWAGLDPNTGDPRVYLNGKVVTVDNTSVGDDIYNKLIDAPVSNLHYFGSLVPVYYGSFRNTFSYGSFSLSANILYKLHYYFRRPSSDVVQYSSLYSSQNQLLGAEYANRWQKPGDEKTTNVPSFTYPISVARDQIYQYADINVLKADNIRLQEINFSYTLSKKNWFIKNPRIYANVSNLGIIWRANKLGLDPDINDYPRPRAYSLGLSANF